MRTALTLCAALLGAAPAAADPADIVGVYRGIVWSGDDNDGTTIFTISPAGAVTGTYIFDADGQPSAGELTDCALTALRLDCTWRDEFGAGDFLAFFTPDFRAFDGGWFADSADRRRAGLDGSYRWDGTRGD